MQQNVKVRKRKSSFAKRNEKWGFILLAPWMIGVLIFFLKPLVEAVIYSFHDVSMGLGTINMTWVGFDNYVYVMTSHATYYQELITTFTVAVPDSIIIVIFALFAVNIFVTFSSFVVMFISILSSILKSASFLRT